MSKKLKLEAGQTYRREDGLFEIFVGVKSGRHGRLVRIGNTYINKIDDEAIHAVIAALKMTLVVSTK